MLSGPTRPLRVWQSHPGAGRVLGHTPEILRQWVWTGVPEFARLGSTPDDPDAGGHSENLCQRIARPTVETGVPRPPAGREFKLHVVVQLKKTSA